MTFGFLIVGVNSLNEWLQWTNGDFIGIIQADRRKELCRGVLL